MTKLEYFAVALAITVLVGWSGRYLNAGRHVDALCGSDALISMNATTAPTGATFDAMLAQCRASYATAKADTPQ